MTERLGYLLHRYDPNSAEHLFHLYGFLERIASDLDLTLFVEEMGKDIRPPVRTTVIPLHARDRSLRFLEEVALFARARVLGTRKFYVHYSYSGAVAASIVTRVMGGETFYWNCGMYKAFEPGPGASLRKRLGYLRGALPLELVLHLCNWLVTGTPRMARYYAQSAGIPLGKIHILPNFVETSRFQVITRHEARTRLGLSDEARVLLFLHRVASYRGAHYLADIAQAITGAVGPVQVVVAGDGPYLCTLREEVQKRGLAGQFDFRGWVANREVPLYYRAADLYVMPSDVEGFPRVLLEAMAAGCPFVSFDVGGVRDVLSDRQQGLVVTAGDVAAFSRKCVELLGSAAEREALALEGYRRAAVFGLERIAAAFVGMISGIPPSWDELVADSLGSAM